MANYETHVKLLHNTARSCTTSVSEIDNYDWDGHSRSDMNFHRRRVNAGASIQEREELHTHARSARLANGRKAANGMVALLKKTLWQGLLLLFVGVVLAQPALATHDPDSEAFSDELTLTGINYPDWMGKLPGSLFLWEISIPGTHDTMTHKMDEFDPVEKLAQTQSLSLENQLKYGIRFLDIRTRRINNTFAIHHGTVYLRYNFADVLNIVTQFLSQHSTETILMRVAFDAGKGFGEDANPKDTTLTNYQILRDYMNSYDQKYFWVPSNPPTIPTLDFTTIHFFSSKW